MTNPVRPKSQNIILNQIPLTCLLIFLFAVVSSNSQSTITKTQRLIETNNTLEHLVATLDQTILKVNQSSSNFSDLQNRLRPKLKHRHRCAFEDCLELLDDTISNLKTAISELQSTSLVSYNVKMLLSDAMTNQDTCLDGFSRSGDDNSNDSTYGLDESLKESILNISNDLGNSLDMLRKLPGNNYSLEASEVEFPSWVLENDQRLIQAPMQETLFNLSVAKDGTGNFTTISAAVSAAPNSSQTRFVIYIKGGEYFENVEIGKKKTMIMLVGDGIGKTVITANRSYVDGWSTFHSATVGVRGDDFIAKDISFVNTAGPTKHQAVALRSGSHRSAFYRCAFEGYQDTLYVHSATQFYRECDVFGTIDFICGNAAVVFQNCSLYARKPILGQKIVFTAQSRNESDHTTGISIINSRILAAADLIPEKAKYKAYLGRPWRKYSRTVVIKSYIDDLIDPAGWLEWSDKFELETLYYGEYMNEGPGANMTDRVKWLGFRPIKTAVEAYQFTVGPFIHGNAWLNSTNIPFSLGL